MNKARDKESTPRVETSRVIDTTGTALYEGILDPKTGETFFIDKDGEIHDSVEMGGTVYVPIPSDDDALNTRCVLLPSGLEEYGTTQELIKEIQEHIHKYLEVTPRYEKIASWYVLFSWIYDRLDTVPYLRTRGDTGTGKNRFQDTIGGICYKPMFTAGAVTPAVIYRLITRFKGTLIIDEADFYRSDATNEIIKILNCGFQIGRPVARCQKDNPDNIQYFNTYGPKILSTRKDFTDKATEGRCITHINREMTRNDIPINLPRCFHQEQDILRDKLLKWRLDHWEKIDPDKAQGLNLGIKLNPRLMQVMGYFPLLFKDDPEMMTFYKETLLELNNEMVEERSASYDGMIVNTLLSLLDDGYTDITPGIIATEMKEKNGLERVTPQSIGKHLKSLGIKTQPPKRIGGEIKRCLDLDPILIKQLRMRYQIDNGTHKGNTKTLDEWNNTCNTHPTEGTVTSVTSVTNNKGTNGGITKKSNLSNTDTGNHLVPYTNVTNVTHVTQQKKNMLHVDNGISIEDKKNGNNGDNGGAQSPHDSHTQLEALKKAIQCHDPDGKGVHYATLRDDKELMAHFTSEEELYRFIDNLLEEREGGIYSPREGYLELTNKEGT